MEDKDHENLPRREVSDRAKKKSVLFRPRCAATTDLVRLSRSVSEDAPVQIRSVPNTGDAYSSRTVNGLFNVPYYLISNKDYETRPPVYSPYPGILEKLTICRCKGSTFSVILRP